MNIPKALLQPLAVSLLAGCSSIYVANVKFTAPEICSEELASRLQPNSGCLPPTRVANVQRMYLERFRPQLSPSQAKHLDAAEAGDPTDNFMPSVLGRVFVAAENPETHGALAPQDGNLEFLPIGNVRGGSPPETKLRVEVNLRTDIRGVTNRQAGLGVAADPAKIVDIATEAAGLPAGKVMPFHDALLDKVATLSYRSVRQNMGAGSYMYVTLSADELDSLNQLLAVCGMSIPAQAPGTAHDKAGPADRVGAMAGSTPPDAASNDRCERALAGESATQTTQDFVRTLRAASRTRPEVNRAGIIVGAAVLRTHGKSALCDEKDLGLVAAGQAVTTPSCADLKAVLDAGTLSNPERPGDITPALSNTQKADILFSISAQLADSTFKDLDAHEHTSILAFHWIPIRLQ